MEQCISSDAVNNADNVTTANEPKLTLQVISMIRPKLPTCVGKGKCKVKLYKCLSLYYNSQAKRKADRGIHYIICSKLIMSVHSFYGFCLQETYMGKTKLKIVELKGLTCTSIYMDRMLTPKYAKLK